jgi:hypothetical protein
MISDDTLRQCLLANAWGWTYYFQESAGAAARRNYSTYLKGALEGRGDVEAFKSAFNSPDMKQLDTDFRQWTIEQFKAANPSSQRRQTRRARVEGQSELARWRRTWRLDPNKLALDPSEVNAQTRADPARHPARRARPVADGAARAARAQRPRRRNRRTSTARSNG